MPFLISYFFKGTGSAGWTESFYDSSASYAALLTKADTVIRPSRLGLLSAAWALRQIRVSDVSINRDSQVKSYTFAQGQGLASPTTLDPGDWGPGFESMPPQVALLVRMEAGALNRRMMLLRGVPLGGFGADLVWNPSGAFLGLFNIWAGVIIGPSGHQVRLAGAGPLSFPTAVVAIPPGFQLQLTYPGNAPAGMVAGVTIRLSRFLGAAFVNGNWRVSSVNQPGGPGTQTTVITFPKQRQVYGVPANVGSVQVLTPTYTNFTAAIPLRGAKRNVGRPFDLLRGRARVRRN